MRSSRSKTDARIEQFGKAIGSRTRAHILRLLSGEPRAVQAVGEAVGRSSQPGVSQHLKVLKDAGLVTSERMGQQVYYSFNPKEHKRMLHSLASSISPNKTLNRPVTQ